MAGAVHGRSLIARAVRGVCAAVWLLAAAVPACRRRFPRTGHLQRPAGARCHRHRDAAVRRAPAQRATRRYGLVGSAGRLPLHRPGRGAVDGAGGDVRLRAGDPRGRAFRPTAPPPVVELALLPLAEMTRGLSPPVPVAPAAATAPAAPEAGHGACARERPGRVGCRTRARSRARTGGGFQRAAANPNAAPAAAVDSGRRERLPRRRQRCAQRRRHGRGRRPPDQRQRQQRRRVAVRAGARVRQQPARRPRSLYNGGFGAAHEQLGVGRAPVFVHGAAGAQARLQRPAVRRHLRRPAQDPAPDAPRPELLRRLPAHPGSQRHDAVGAGADAARARGRLLAVAQRVRPAGADRRSRHRPAVCRQRHPRGSDQPAGGVAARLLPAAERRAASGFNYQTPHHRRRRGRTAARRACTHQFGNGREQFAGHVAYQRTTTDVDQPVRVRRHDADHRVSTSTSTGRTASSQFMFLRVALSVHAPDHRRDAVLREPHQRVGRTPASPATIRTRSTGDRRR